jgi:hypothetical protein
MNFPHRTLLARRAILASGAAALATNAAAQGIDLGGSGEGVILGPADAPDPITLPILYEGGHVLVEVAVASAPPAPFVLDTGAGSNTIDAGYADEIRLASSGYLNAEGVAGRRVRAGVAHGVPLFLGSLNLTGQSTVVIDMPNHLVDRGKKPRIAGLIGAPAFAGRIIRIDVARHELTILPPGSPPDPAGLQIPLGIAYQKPGQIDPVNGMKLDIELDGSVLSARFDTGSGGAIFLPRDVAEQTGAMHRYPKYLPFVSPGGIDGRLSFLEALGTRLSIGDAEIPSPFLAIMRDSPSPWPGRRAQPRQEALLGMGALQYFIPFIDVPGGRLVLEPGGIPQRSPVVYRAPGLSAAKFTRDAFEILSVLQGSPAERAGLSPGNRIVAVNGTPAIDLGANELYPALHHPDAPIVFTLADGRQCPTGSVQLLP